MEKALQKHIAHHLAELAIVKLRRLLQNE